MGRSAIGRLTSGIGILHLLATLPLIVLVAGDILAAGIFGGASDSFPPTTSSPVACQPIWPGTTHPCAPRHGSAPPSLASAWSVASSCP